MRYFIAINLIICAGIGYVLRNANPGESCNAEGIEHLRNTFPLTWGCVCGHESYSWLPLPLAFLVLPPLGMAYAYAGKNSDFACCIIYLLALLPALYFLL